MGKVTARLASLAGTLCVGGVILMCSSTVAGAQSVSFIAPRRDFAAGARPESVAVANGNSNNVSVLLGNGDGTFGPAVNFGAGVAPSSVAVGDFNGDGRLDLAVANGDSNNVSVLLCNGDRTFGPAVDFGAGVAASSVAVGGFNGDGKLDL